MYLDFELFIDHEIDPTLVVPSESGDVFKACHVLADNVPDSVLYAVQKHASW
jgi:hypothetical protein